MTAREIRSGFLSFFKERGHTIVPSSPVIPYEDPTLLFANAGMNQFKDVFLGTGKRDYRRAVDSQKCIRVSGKHNDLEEVGRDTYHHTFFEMLGNWSFGDYYKSEAIHWAWGLLTGVWGIEKRRLYATVFETDDEAAEYWKSVTDIDPAHIQRFGKKDNFWEMGETGPCGPCSEIHIDLTPDYSGGQLVNAGDPRVMEIWNLVFIQYDRDGKGTLTPLPAKHVDTGMGFERICAVLQGKKSNYDTDVFMPIISRIAGITGKQYSGSLNASQSEVDVAFRVIADHARMLSFSIADGGIPSNEGRGYVMRRIVRRAARFGRSLEMHEPFIYNIVDAVASSMGDQYPEVREKQSLIERVIKGEEESFNVTLDRGLEIFESVAKRVGPSKTFPGDEAFKLYDTFGFPPDLTELIAHERGLTVEMSRFAELMSAQKSQSRGATGAVASASAGGSASGSGHVFPGKGAALEFTKDLDVRGLRFVGYETLEGSGSVVKSDRTELVVDSTPFYGESGGQVGDEGVIIADGREMRVITTLKANDAIVHVLEQESDLTKGQRVRLMVGPGRRRNVERNHTATHLVHEALRRVLGTHAHQQGSLVAPDHLRFDFNHFERITPDQLNAIEDIVNEKISQSINVFALNDPNDWLTIDEAKRRYPNVKMFFGEKYGERVRIVEIDPAFSVELCGGTHVRKTKEIGYFKIISEASVASGIRRIEAVTGEGLDRYIQKRLESVGELDRQLEKLLRERDELERELGRHAGIQPAPRPSLGAVSLPAEMSSRERLAAVDLAARLREEELDNVSKAAHDLKKELSKYRVKEASSGLEEVISRGIAVNGFKVVSARIEAGTAEELKSLADRLREKLPSGVGVLGAVIDQKVALVCVVTDDLIKDKKLQAGKIVGELAKRVGGGGGGRPHLATAGGKDISKLDETLQQAAGIVQSMVSG
jgi:alanyl-tRNA synthetase